MLCWRIWFSGDTAVLVSLDDLKGLFQPKWFYGSIPNFSQEFCTSFPPLCWLLARSNVAIAHLNRYSAAANSMDHSCSCCRESKSSLKEVTLKCPDGNLIQHKYPYVETCSCQDTECNISQSSGRQKREENNTESTLKRLKRAISLASKWRRKHLAAVI